MPRKAPDADRIAPNLTLRKALSRRPLMASDQHLVVAGAVEVAGVQKRHPGVERGGDGGDGLRVVA